MQYLKIPNERLGVLIGEHGALKKEIESRTNTRISIEDTAVTIESTITDCLGEMVARNIVQAIGRGFNPENALRLLNDECTLEIIPLTDYVKSPNAYERLKGRVIGEGGKARKVMEELSGANISVYGKTIGIIGSFDDVALAKEAVLMLLDGARHSSVYRMLEKAQAQRKSGGWEGSSSGLAGENLEESGEENAPEAEEE